MGYNVGNDISVYIVWGCPASGKTRYVREHMQSLISGSEDTGSDPRPLKFCFCETNKTGGDNNLQ